MLLVPSANFNSLLAPGDRMELDEFLELWEQSPELKFAELIDGFVYMPSPISTPHARFDGSIHSILGYYALKTNHCEILTNPTWLMAGGAPQPDLAVSLFSRFGGRQKAVGNLTSGLPELVVEICRSSRSYDLGPKLALYERAGVPEYLAIVVDQQRFEWRIHRGSRFELLPPQQGIYRSEVLPGLWIDEAAFWRGDRARMIAILEEGIHSTPGCS